MAKTFGQLATGTTVDRFDRSGAGDVTVTPGIAPKNPFEFKESGGATPRRTTKPLVSQIGKTSGGRGGGFDPVLRGTQITEFGTGDFDASLVDWNAVFNEAQKGSQAAFALIDQFAPGGGFGTGLRQEATELVQGGVAADSAAAVRSGSSSISSARGINTLAGSELSKQFANIEDLRAGLQVQSFSPFTQMLSNLTSLISVRPTEGRDVQRITTAAPGTRTRVKQAS